jgi:CRP/FNR family transcriptional regulator, cyclic AMP receptor protein
VSIVNDLRTLPLFKGISETHLTELVAAFRPVTKKAGTVLFTPGDIATTFDLLTKGEVLIEEEGAVRFELREVAPLGELGAFTGIPRSTKATATTDVDLLSIPVGDLLGFFDRHGDVGFAFTKNLLGMVSDKLRRDRRLLGEMRTNIIRTQKAMKQMRDIVLENPETEMSKPIFETLDTLIDNNRRANYRVSPTEAFPAQVRLDDGRAVPVMEVSEGYIKLEGTTKALLGDAKEWTGVFVTPKGEILVSGTVLREGEGGVVMKLDPMIDDYKKQLDDYVTRVQLLDYVV